MTKKIDSSDDETDDDIGSSLDALIFQKENKNKRKNKSNIQIDQILNDKVSNSSSITPIDNDEIKQSVSSIMISDSDSESDDDNDNDNNNNDNDNSNNNNNDNDIDIDISSDSDIEHINNLAKKDKEFFEIYNKYMNL